MVIYLMKKTILNTMKKIASRLQEIVWPIKIEPKNPTL